MTQNLKQITVIGNGIHTDKQGDKYETDHQDDIELRRKRRNQHKQSQQDSNAGNQHIPQAYTLE